MDQLVQCPVCTLFLHNGMSLESHLDTHPKDQVIKALCSLSKSSGTNYGSRTPTPMHSERSYRSRSRTPATEDGSMKWSGSRNSDHDRYWRRTPSRTPKTSSASRVTTPASEDRLVDVTFDNSPLNDGSQYSNPPYPMKSDKMQQTYVSPAMCDYDQQTGYYQDQQEDKEIKYSRSAEYSSIENPSNVFTYNMPPAGQSLKLPTTMLPAVSRRSGELVKVLQKPNNILLKTSVGGVHYLPPGVKPMHVMMPTAPTFVQKNVQNNMIMTSGSQNPQILDSKNHPAPLTNQFNQITSGTFAPAPGTTVVTQNSQIIYREMVHNIDGKPFISSIPAVLSGHENVTNIAQASSMYQNVMVVDQYGNTSCMYTPPQSLMPKSCNAPVYSNATQVLTHTTQEDKSNNVANDVNKTLVIEVGPIVNEVSGNRTLGVDVSRTSIPPHPSTEIKSKRDVNLVDKPESRNDTHTPTPTTKGLKILSNIKVEVPVQHHKNMLNTILDLTGPGETEYQERSISPDRILPDLDDNNMNDNDCPQPSNSSANRIASPAYSGRTPLCTESPKPDDNRIETEFSDSCPVPDLICNEKPSISPCSELSEQDNSIDRTSISPKPHISQTRMPANNVERIEQKVRPAKTFNNPLRLNNIFVKKNKKVLQIKNLKPLPTTSTYSTAVNNPGPSSSESRSPENFTVTKFHHEKGKEKGLYTVPAPSSSKCPSPVNFTINKIHQEKSKEKDTIATPSSSKCKSAENFTINNIHHEKSSEKGMLHTVSIEKIRNCTIDNHSRFEGEDTRNDNHHKQFDDGMDNDIEHREFDADTEEQSMDIEPVAPSSLNSNQFSTSVDVVQVKEEINTSTEVSNEAGYSNETITSLRRLTPVSPRPLTVINYGNMAPGEFDDESNHKELLDLEAASKSKQFVNMMNENYFGDNIYADYFTPDRVEAFGNKDTYSKEGQKDGMYIWGEPSQKESEFVLPNFIHESYKVVNTAVDYSEMEEGHQDGDGDGCDRDSKADVLSESRSEGEPPLNICADERMPPRGELSGQESNGDMESPWMYPDVTPTEPYDLIARESWVSDGSEADANEKRDTLEEELNLSKARLHTCSQCGAKLSTAKELRAHRAVAHALPTSSGAKTSYSRLITARTIKKEEEKHDEHVLGGNLMQLDSKEVIAKTMLQVYDAMNEAKPKLERLIKQEAKRKRKDFVCPTCKVDQLSDPAFHAHLKIHPLECLTCGKCFFRRANLSLHIKTHLGIKNFKCDVCEKSFITRQKLMEHHNVHTGRAPIKCTLCDYTFRRYSNMVQHRDRHHFQKKSKVRDFVCHCGAVFHSRAKLLWHKETHDDKPKACLYCSDKFVHSSSLTRHVRRTHNEYYLSEKNKGKAENVPCPVCKQVYLRTNLRAHLLTHSGKRPYVCIICNKAFTTKWNLKLHRWTHMSRSAKPYKCSLCKGAFIRHTEYISHMNAHKSVRPYTCNYCGCQFIRKYNCQRHVREHEMAKKYVCKVPECGKSFHRSYYLSEHMKVHSGARPFSCSICGKTSSNKSNHNKHVKIHHAREPIATEA